LLGFALEGNTTRDLSELGHCDLSELRHGWRTQLRLLRFEPVRYPQPLEAREVLVVERHEDEVVRVSDGANLSVGERRRPPKALEAGRS
jgi:hypothetical protein